MVMNMHKPRILLSTSKLMKSYEDAVNGCGGIAVAKYLPEVDLDYDGLILCGGSDMDPSYYGEEVNGSVEIDNTRDQIEIALLQAYVDAGKPVLGICRGHQLINVFFGGSLYQHIENAHEHTTGTNYDTSHVVKAAEGSVAEQLYGKEFAVNSYHHQAIKELGKGLKVTMMTADNRVIEGVEHCSLPVLAVQWHPERMCFADRREDTVDGRAIFDYFVDLCRNRNKD